jgi:hypothetical protein
MTCSPEIRFVTRSSLLLLALAGACGQTDDDLAVAAPAPAAPPKQDPIAKGVPHAGHISQIAVTDKADAALTFDNTGGVRLWPALDGSRTPVPVSVVAPEQLALAHAGRDLLAAILDEAGSVRVMRLGRDGTVRGDVQLPAEVTIEQVIAIDDSVILRREDQTLEWFSANGDLRGRLVAEPAHKIQALAARNGAAVAIVTNGNKYQMRWLTLAHGKLSWDSMFELPAPVKGELFALSPSHRRIAFVDTHNTLAVYDLGLVPTRVGDTASATTASDMGFVDEEHVALMGPALQWWTMPAKPAKDPWEVTTPRLLVPSTIMAMTGGAVGDHGVVMGYGASLSITDTGAVRYLGYREHGAGNLVAAGSSLAVAMSGSHVMWLDNKLAIKREIELRETETSPWIYATAISERHVVTQAPFEGKYKVELIDVDDRERPITLGTFDVVHRIEHTSGILAVSSGSKIHRFKLDLATNGVTPMTTLRTRGSPISLRVLDPDKARGFSAVVLAWASDYDDYYTLSMYREQGKPKHIRSFKGRMIDIDDNGNIYVVEGNEIQTRHGETKVASFKLEHVGAVAAVAADGSKFALQVANDLVVVDNKGAEQWRKSLWGMQQLVFSKDGKHLAVRANGGVVLLDTTTGERTAMECGWTFSLMTKPPPTNALASAPVCEDPML